MDELTRLISSLGLPGWVVIILVLLIVLHRLGVLQSLNGLVTGIVSDRQNLMAKLVDKALNQNGILITFVTDQLLSKVEDVWERMASLEKSINRRLDRAADKMTSEVKEYSDQVIATTKEHSDRITRLETHIRMITYHLTEQDRAAKRDEGDQNFRLISDLQERLAGLESRDISDEPAKQNDKPDI